MQKLNILIVNVHGLIRGERLELGRDADTGGQSRYVMDEARALVADRRVGRVDILSRLVADKTVGRDYSLPREEVAPGLSILRVPFGGNRYLRKELLWPHLDEAVDNAVKLLRSADRVPDLVHGHYADGGYVAMNLARFFGLPFFFTGHSLGRLKRARLIEEGADPSDLEKRFSFERRIGAEEELLSVADRVVASTRHEIDTQYSLYDNKDYGSFEVIPPGFDLGRFLPYYDDHPQESPQYHPAKSAAVNLRDELSRFLTAPDKPLIIAVGRPDKRKNLSGLVELYGRSRELQAIGNLVVFAGIRKDISAMEESERDVLVELLLLMDKYDLYGKLAIPKRHDVDFEIPELYRVAAQSRGVFVNLALNENFGLTLLEAAACGVPVVATSHGGPVDIVANLDNGSVVDPEDEAASVKAVTDLLVDRELWMRKSAQGIRKVRSIYSWRHHVDRYLGIAGPIVEARAPRGFGRIAGGEPPAIGERLGSAAFLFVSDIDGTLLDSADRDSPAARALREAIASSREKLVFAVATGRHIDSARAVLRDAGFPEPELYLTSVGTEIYYRDRKLLLDKGWASRLRGGWRPEELRKSLEGIDGLVLQSAEAQREFKISYDYSGSDPDIRALIHRRLADNRLRCGVVWSHGRFVDILPVRADKGKAVRYLCFKWDIPYGRVVTAGDSGNDESMLRGGFKAIAVANRSEELAHLKARPNLHLAEGNGSAGVLEGLRRYGAV